MASVRIRIVVRRVLPRNRHPLSKFPIWLDRIPRATDESVVRSMDVSFDSIAITLPIWTLESRFDHPNWIGRRGSNEINIFIEPMSLLEAAYLNIYLTNVFTFRPIREQCDEFDWLETGPHNISLHCVRIKCIINDVQTNVRIRWTGIVHYGRRWWWRRAGLFAQWNRFLFGLAIQNCCFHSCSTLCLPSDFTGPIVGWLIGVACTE